MPFENGVNWEPVDPDKRGRHKTVTSAFEAAFKDLTTEHNEFYDSLVDNWRVLFPRLAARPGRYENGRIYIYVRNSSAAFAIRPKLREIVAKLQTLPGAPAKIDLRVEQHVL